MSSHVGKQFAAMAPEEFAAQPGTHWHGSPSGLVGSGNAHYGLHVGSREAARQALNARIGRPDDGRDWDGTREYGRTPLGGYSSGYGAEHLNGRLPSGRASYSDGTPVPLTSRPSITPVRIIGKMTNTPSTPHEDFRANGLMAGQIKRGRAKSGYHYRNVGEDAGSSAAVVPNRDHLRTHFDYVREAYPLQVDASGREHLPMGRT